MINYPDFLSDETLTFYSRSKTTDGTNWGSGQNINGKILIKNERIINSKGLTIESKGAFYTKDEVNIYPESKINYNGETYLIERVEEFRAEGRLIFKKAVLV